MNFPSNFDLTKFDDCRLLVVGDLMIDEYVWGKVDRISPNAGSIMSMEMAVSAIVSDKRAISSRGPIEPPRRCSW